METTKISFYNRNTRFLMLFVLVPIFAFLTILFVSSQNTFLYLIASFFVLVIGILIYKTCLVTLEFSEKGVYYKSLFKERWFLKDDLVDVLVMSKQRRSQPVFIDFIKWHALDIQGGNDFLILRTEAKLPQQTSFVFSEPLGVYYCTVQYREDLEKWMLYYLNK